jgi:hypothetical protein
MYINAIVSFLNAWQNLEKDKPHIPRDLMQSLDAVDLSEFRNKERRHVKILHSSPIKEHVIETRYLVSPQKLVDSLRSKLESEGWQPNVRLNHWSNRSRRFMTLDFLKDDVGLELSLGKEAYVESRLFVGFPRFVKADIFSTALVLVPMSSLAKQVPAVVGNFESISDMLQETRPLPLKYPFAVVGFSERQTPISVTSLTSDLDSFLIGNVGMSLDEMSLLNERPEYDFKVLLPRNEKLAQEICGFANLKSGGYILLGVDKNGKPVGLPKGKALDDIQLQITNVIHANCRPTPRFEFFVFDNPQNETSAIVVVKVHSLERKPCMVDNRVHIRSGPSVRLADSEEIRRLVLE